MHKKFQIKRQSQFADIKFTLFGIRMFCFGCFHMQSIMAIIKNDWWSMTIKTEGPNVNSILSEEFKGGDKHSILYDVQTPCKCWMTIY